MTKYHISPMTGNPGPCNAKIRCPLGASTEHYPDKASAQKGEETFQNSIQELEIKKITSIATLDDLRQKLTARRGLLRPKLQNLENTPITELTPETLITKQREIKKISEEISYYTQALNNISDKINLLEENRRKEYKSTGKLNPDFYGALTEDVDYFMYENVPYADATHDFPMCEECGCSNLTYAAQCSCTNETCGCFE